LGKKQYLLSIDNGTQSVRALLFDLEGNLIGKSQIHLEAYFSEHPGWAEQHPEYFWKNLCLACQSLWDQVKIDKKDIAGLSITTQRATMINLDRQAKPLRPAIIWLDQRNTKGLKPINGLWGMAFKLAGASKTIRYFQAEAEANWIQRHQPEIWEKTDKYLLLSGYLIHRFTGQFKDSIGSQVGYIPFDYKRHRWSGSKDWKWKAIPITPSMLPELVPPTTILGVVTDQAAKETGIPQGLPVIAAASDKACEVIGAGCLSPDIGCLSYGTTATINTTSSKYIEAIPMIPPYPAAIPNTYSTEVPINRGYWMVSWFKKEFGHREQRIAEERGIQPEQLFDELVNQVPAGSMGLLLQPYWSPGVRIPGPEAKGAIIGFGDVHTRAHMYRAILEGLAYGLREGKERIEKRSGTAITSLRVSGGGSQSDAAMQLTADIFGLSASRPHLYDTSGLGAAIDAAVGLGLYPDFETAIAKMTRIGRTFHPNPETRKIYDQLYKRVYKKMYGKLQPFYEAIQDITGYPSKPH